MVKILSISLILLAIIAITYGRSTEYKIDDLKFSNEAKTYEREDEAGFEASLHLNIGLNSNSEDENTGEDNTGEDNTGEDNTGEDDTGEDNTGEDDTGEDNTGEDNTGEDNTGEDNTGEDNTGEDNTGEGNTGEGDTGEDNTGEGNTGEGDIDGVKNLQELTEENIGIKQELKTAKQSLVDLIEENNGIKQELKTTKQSLAVENQHLQIQLNETEKKFKNENEVLITKLEKTEQLLNSTEQKLSNENEVLSTKLEKSEEKLSNENEVLSTKLEKTEQKLSTLEKKFEDYKAAFFTRFSELFYEMNRVKSCKDVPKAKGTTRDGSYVIQPDPSLPAFDVECSFNGSTATTTIHHNSEEEIEVSDCKPAKCYGRNIVYDATIPQIRALISLSGTCRQYIKYRCHHSVMFENGNNFAGWETWNGTMRHYWGGSGGRDGYCACGITGTCADASYKCNCDKNDNAWREDAGFLDQEEDLPATKLYFGDTNGSNEHGRHTLGSLQCQQSL